MNKGSILQKSFNQDKDIIIHTFLLLASALPTNDLNHNTFVRADPPFSYIISELKGKKKIRKHIAYVLLVPVKVSCKQYHEHIFHEALLRIPASNKFKKQYPRTVNRTFLGEGPC